MKDVLGTEVQVGDRVAYIHRAGRSYAALKEGVIVGFTPQRTIIDPDPGKPLPPVSWNRNIKKQSDKFVRIR